MFFNTLAIGAVQALHSHVNILYWRSDNSTSSPHALALAILLIPMLCLRRSSALFRIASIKEN